MAMMGSTSGARKPDGLVAMFDVLADPEAYKEKWQALEARACEAEARFVAAAQGIADVQEAAELKRKAETLAKAAEVDRAAAAHVLCDAKAEANRLAAAHRENVGRWESDLGERRAAIVADAKIADEAGKAARVLMRQAEALMQEADARDAHTREVRERVEIKIRAYQEAGE